MRKLPAASRLEHIRHSLAHLLAAAVLKKFPDVLLGIGPVIENGFYYDFKFKKEPSADVLPELEKEMRRLISSRLPFTGEKVAAAGAKKLFRDQPFKLDLVKEFVRGKKPLTVYKTGDAFFDLCRGGHVKNTEEIDPEAFKLTHLAGAYWRGSEKNPQLTRIYALAFTTKKELDDHLKLQDEIEKRDHRKLGERLDLFSFHDVAPGAPFWHPNGMVVFRELEKFIREELDREGYGEISTPIVVKSDVFERSGHWQYYRENMFSFKHGKETLVLKPMNCPESTYIYGSQVRSYRDLPLRFSEIGRLHRNELSGTLGGLFRVRQITMDDAHIYCRMDQAEGEIKTLLKLVGRTYNLFGFKEQFYLATRPESALGDKKLWSRAESALEAALEHNKVPFEVKPKDGAFYGPKIDIHIKDALGRDWQLATIQLDLAMLPERFALSYADEKGRRQKPVVIHRAIFGSFERFIGILVEHFAGALPLWLSPVQAEVITVGSGQKKFAQEVWKNLQGHGVRARLSDENLTVGKRIREAEMQKIPYILVVGEKEEKNGTVNVRHYRRGPASADLTPAAASAKGVAMAGRQEGEVNLEKLLERIALEIAAKTI